ncbi:MAG: hypothetical protein C5B53_02740 [Candidatus Melainabacteria bacterium]|nr:MAG: hypothetical protein C5B53_02740 [Candidatus Melainabacteria bacterium]
MKTIVRKPRIKRGDQRGITLGLVAVLGILLTIIGLGLFTMSMILGGARETRNAVESGALNVGKQSLTVAVSPSAGDQQQFMDVADSNGQFELKNIDRVWGKATLASINESAMESEGSSSSTSSAHAQQLQQAAQDLSTQLSQQLNQANNLYGFFEPYAQAGSVRMLGAKTYVDVVADGDWQTALMDRGAESNIAVDPTQLPSGFDATSLQLVTAKDGNQYLPGYTQVQLLGSNFWFVPFKVSEKPHLVAGNHFQENTLAADPLSWTDAVPNAFAVHGGTINSNQSQQKADAAVITNPQLIFKMAMPQAFVRIDIQANTLQWNLDGIDMDSTNYPFMPGDVETSFTYPLPCGTIWGTEYCGNEYLTGPTLFTALFAQPPIPPMSSKTFDYLLQRVQEIHPGYKASDLTGLLVATPIDPSATSDQQFVIYAASNESSAPILCTPASAAPSWTSSQPDGTYEILETEGPLGPNFGLTELDCYGAWEYPTYTDFYGERGWTPGTGYDGCLGTMQIHRTTTAYLFGFCACP